MNSQFNSGRVDGRGRAFAGSQRWIQYYVNWQPEALNDAILAALPSLRESSGDSGDLHWVSPLEDEKFQEYRDEDFLHRVGAIDQMIRLRDFWPRGGPCWDALARVDNGRQQGIILVEAKSYPGELFSGGCRAGSASRAKIGHALQATKLWLGANGTTDWFGPLYQSANRLAHLYFLRELVQIPAWLINVCFTLDPHSPTTEAEWRGALQTAAADLGLEGIGSPFLASVFLEAKKRPA